MKLLVCSVLFGFSTVNLLADEHVGAGCPVTRSGMYSYGLRLPTVDSWFGSEVLAVKVPADSSFISIETDGSVKEGLEFWSSGYQLGSESELAVTGRRMGTQLVTDIVTSRGSYRDFEGNWMMTLNVEFPETGCWKVTADYYGERISIIVRVEASERTRA